MDRSKLLALASKAAKLLDQWTQVQDGAILLVGNFGNLLQRIPDLTTLHSYGGLAPDEDLPDVQRRVLAKQLKSMSAVLERLKQSTGEMVEIVRSQEKLCVEAWAVVGGAASTAVSCANAAGGVGSAAHMVEAMEDVWCMCRDELCLKAAIAFQLHPGMSGNDFQELYKLFSASVNMCSHSTSYLTLQNTACTAERL